MSERQNNTVLIIDNRELSHETSRRVISSALPSANVLVLTHPLHAIEFAKHNGINAVFLDTDTVDSLGLNVAGITRAIRGLQGNDTFIFFTAEDDQYAKSAFSLHVNGYFTKPINFESLLDNVRLLNIERYAIKARMFGGFELSVDGEPLNFKHPKPKELMAYLIHGKGVGLSMANVAAALWEDRLDTPSLQSLLRNVVAELRRELNNAGIGDIIIKKRNSIAVAASKLTCDYYDYLDGRYKPTSHRLAGYLPGYSWARDTDSVIFEER